MVVFPRLWALLIEECEELRIEVDWEWQAADSAMGKARLGGDEVRLPIRLHRAKKGSKKTSILTDRHGGPLSVGCGERDVVNANCWSNDSSRLVDQLPKPTEEKPQHLCLDKGYDDPSGEAAMEEKNITTPGISAGLEKRSSTRVKKVMRLAAGSWKGH